MMAAPTNMHNLTTLIKRLEAATSRLEDIATSVDSSAPNGVAGAAVLPTQTAAATESQTTLTAVPQAKTPEPVPQSIEDFDKLINTDVKAFVDASSKVGGLVEEQAKSVQQAFGAERTFLLVTTKAKKPDQPPPELTADLHRYTSAVDEIKETNRPSPLFNHLTSVTEVITLLSWIMTPNPAEHVKEALGGAQFYGNKVLKEYKDKDPNHVEFIKAYYQIYKSLTDYVKKNFPNGLTWNNKDGIDAMEALKQVQSPETSTASNEGAAPPPPPPPLPNLDNSGAPPPPPPPPASSGGAKGGDMTAVFEQLNQGSSVTAGLRKVDKSEMTHKNPSLRAGAIVPQRSESQTSTTSSGRAKSPMPARKPESLKSKKPSKKELDGTKWIVEYFENTGSEVVEIDAEINHSILISRCQKCTIKIVGKANAISIDNCSGLQLLVESLVSSIDVIKATKFAVQIDGVLPTVLLDQVDGGQIYLSEASIKSPPEIFTSKCSSINIVTPPKGDEDSKEEPLPEQIRTYFKNGKLVSEVVEHAG